MCLCFVNRCSVVSRVYSSPSNDNWYVMYVHFVLQNGELPKDVDQKDCKCLFESIVTVV